MRVRRFVDIDCFISSFLPSREIDKMENNRKLEMHPRITHLISTPDLRRSNFHSAANSSAVALEMDELIGLAWKVLSSISSHWR